MTGVRTATALALAGVLVTLAGCAGGSPADRSDAPPTVVPSAAPSESPESVTTKQKEVENPLSELSQAELDRRLLDAAWADDVPRARRLIEAGADVDWRDDTLQSAHLVAASEGYLELVRLTLRNGADVDVHDSFDGTGLIRAAERGHDLVVGRLLQTETPVDHVNNLGWTALHESITLGAGTPTYQATVRALVARGADIARPAERNGQTPLQMARARGQDRVAKILTIAGEPAPADPDAALLAAAEAGDPDRAALALRAGADLEARDAARRTPLLLAVAGDHDVTARLLVALGADPDALDERSDTPWLVTGVTGSVPMAQLLLRFQPDLTVRNRYGGISVIPAAERGHADYVQLMTTTAMDLDHVNDLGWTALLEAVILGDGGPAHQRIVRTLLEAGADPALADREGVTALQHARQKGQAEVARILRRHG